MKTISKSSVLAGFVGGLLLWASSALPVNALITTYALHDHPAGNVSPPLYGLRLNELFDVTPNQDVFTFDFNNPFSKMRLYYDDGGTPGDTFLGDDNIRIKGISYGGLDTGSGYGNPSYRGLWAIDFLYNSNLVSVGVNGSNISVSGNLSNFGSIRSLSGIGGGSPVPLSDRSNGDFTFQFNNTDTISGPDTFTGWGLLTVGNQTPPASDPSGFLFTGTNNSPVPEPTSVLLFGVGLVGLAAFRKKRVGR